MGLLGGRGERDDRPGGGERLDQPIGDRLGEAAPGHPLGDGRAEHVVGHAGGAGGEHVEQAGAAGVLEAAGAQRAHEHLPGPRGAGGIGLAADGTAFGGEPAQDGDGDVALQHGVLGPPELGACGGVGADAGGEPVAAAEQRSRPVAATDGTLLSGDPHGGGLVAVLGRGRA